MSRRGALGFGLVVVINSGTATHEQATWIKARVRAVQGNPICGCRRMNRIGKTVPPAYRYSERDYIRIGVFVDQDNAPMVAPDDNRPTAMLRRVVNRVEASDKAGT